MANDRSRDPVLARAGASTPPPGEPRDYAPKIPAWARAAQDPRKGKVEPVARSVIAENTAAIAAAQRPVEDLGNGQWVDVDPETIKRAARAHPGAYNRARAADAAADRAGVPAGELEAGIRELAARAGAGDAAVDGAGERFPTESTAAELTAAPKGMAVAIDLPADLPVHAVGSLPAFDGFRTLWAQLCDDELDRIESKREAVSRTIDLLEREASAVVAEERRACAEQLAARDARIAALEGKLKAAQIVADEMRQITGGIA